MEDIALERSLRGALGSAAVVEGEVPVVDLSLPAEEVAEQLWRASSEVGFFSVVNHGVDLALVERAYAASATFFAQDVDTKKAQSPFEARMNAGFEYFSQVRPSTGTADQKESLQITARQGAMEGRWPPGQFEDTAQLMLQQCHALASRLLGLLEQRACPHLEPGTLAKAHTLWSPEGQCTLRFLHYPGMEPEALRELAGQGCWRAGAHTDWCNLTLLFQRPGQDGLECRANPRRQDQSAGWVAVPPVAGGIAVNIGDMLARWSDGRLFSNLHRVRLPTEAKCRDSRYSIAFFAQADKSALITSKDAAPITAGDYILSRINSNFQPKQQQGAEKV